MNMNNNHNEPIKTPSQDAQGCWYELLSPTQVLTGQEQHLQGNNQEQQEQKKKKCRGNRNAQRLRRRANGQHFLLYY